MRRRFFTLLLGLLLSALPAVARPVAPALMAAIQREPGLAPAHWGLLVTPVGGGPARFERDADRLFTPASNLKLVTGATAWRCLGPEYRFDTDLLVTGAVSADGIVQGDLILRGHGDPSLATADLQAMVAQSGLHGVTGDVVVDDSAFDSERLGPGWAWDDLPADYSAEVDALCLDRNVVHLEGLLNAIHVIPDAGYVHVDSAVTEGDRDTVDATRDGNQIHVFGTAHGPWKLDVSVHDPALYAGAVLRSLLNPGGVRRGTTPDTGTLLLPHASPPLPQLLSWMLKTSDNLYAEQLLKTCGGGTREGGIALESLAGPHRIVDGSGLSRYNAISPRQLVTLLQQSYVDSPLLQALPIGGVDGTLRHRFLNDGLQGRVRAKTGTMTGVSTLSGVLTTRRGERFVFSWMCNGWVVPETEIKQAEDRLIEALDSALAE